MPIRLHVNVHKINMEFNELKEAINDVLPHAVSCPGLNNTVQKTRLCPTSGNTAHEQLFLVQRQTIPPNHRGIQRSNTVTRNVWHTSPPNTGTFDRKLATQRQNNNPRPIQGRRIHDIGERIWKKHNELLSHGQQFSPPPQIHPHSIKARTHFLGCNSVHREKVHKLQSTGY